MISSILFCLLILILTIYCFYLRFCHVGKLMAKIPGYQVFPIIGNFFDFITSSEQLFLFARKLYKMNPGVMKIYSFNYYWVLLHHPDDIETVLSSSRFNEKRLPYNFLWPWFGQGLLVSNGLKWQQRRKLLTSAFHFNILKQFSNTFQEHTELLLKSVEQEIGKEKTSLMPLIQTATLNVMCETSMGAPVNGEIETISKKYVDSINVISQCVVYRVTRMWTYIELLFQMCPVSWRQKKALTKAHAFTNKIISERRTYRESKRNNFRRISIDECEEYELSKSHKLAMLDLLLEKEANGEIDNEGIREEVDTFMFEGHDTTAVALSYMLMRLANEPEIQEKNFQETDRIFGDSQRKPTIDDLNEMKYLECCIKESLRLYPSVPIIFRHFTEDVLLGGYTIPAGVVCTILVFDMHRREDLFPEPEKFIPERFLPENFGERHRYAYIPFSAGPRNCIGQRFAMLEMKTVMSGLLRKYKLEPVTKPEDLVFIVDLTLKTNHPLYVRFVKRDR